MTDREDGQTHDFDQRHDGPFDTVQSPTSGAPRASLQIQIPDPPARQDSSRSEPMQQKRGMSMQSPVGQTQTPSALRKSVQLPRRSEDPSGMGRPSASMSRTGRPSRDFDVRRDGPYGRPSITMTRRKSSGLPGLATEQSQPETEEQRPTPADLEAMESMPTEVEQPLFEPEPPPLNYSIWDRKYFVFFFWFMIIIDVVAQPIALYFGLWYGTNLSPNIVFSIITAALGGVSIVEYFVRFWRLWKKGSNCRVIGARRMYLDWFHWNFSLGWIVIMIELIVGTVPENPPIRLLAMPLASMLYAFGVEMIIIDTLRFFEIPAPCRISSIPKGTQLRPAIYSIIEDIVAVDGSGGTAYREALNKRYESSHVFRAMLRRMDVFWAVGANGMAVLTTILIFTIQHEAAYCVGWAAPFVWAGIWAAVTIWYVKRKLKEEKIAWTEEIAEKQGAFALANLPPQSSEGGSHGGSQ